MDTLLAQQADDTQHGWHTSDACCLGGGNACCLGGGKEREERRASEWRRGTEREGISERDMHCTQGWQTHVEQLQHVAPDIAMSARTLAEGV